MSNEQKTMGQIINKTINQTVQKLVKKAVFIRFLSYEKTIIDICFPNKIYRLIYLKLIEIELPI